MSAPWNKYARTFRLCLSFYKQMLLLGKIARSRRPRHVFPAKLRFDSRFVGLAVGGKRNIDFRNSLGSTGV